MLSVPENRTQGSGRRIDLFVSVLRATGSPVVSDPLVLLAGGPGGAISREFPKVAGFFGRLNVHRDLVLVDQRGTGHSHPLDCPQPQHGLDENESELKARLAACSTNLDADLREYGTPQAIVDLDAIRSALGYERINMYGGSYGTRVALAYARAYPSHLRSMILDGVVPYGRPLGPRIALDSQRALEGVFARCNGDAACHAAFPDLAGDLKALFDQLKSPSIVGLAHPSTGEFTHVTLSQRVAAGTIRMLSYASETATLLPLLIHEGARGNLSPLAAQALLAERMLELQEGMHFSVICSEDYPFFDSVDTKHTYLDGLVIHEYQIACEQWPRATLPAGFNEPVHSSAPALLLSGELDPVTPPTDAELAQASLPRSRHVVLAGEAHGVLHRGCVTRIAEEFLDQLAPENLDLRCLEGHRPLPLFTSFKGPQP